jgi:hypothetical protein
MPIFPVNTLIEEQVMVDVALIELALNVEYAATPGAPLLILDTVKVDRTRLLDVMVDPDSVE